MTIYFTDVTYAYKIDDDGVVTRYTDPNQNNAYFLSLDPDGLIVWGQPQERVEPAQAAGWRLDLDMGVLDNYWGTSDLPGTVGYQYTVGAGPAVVDSFIPQYGPGAAYDPVTDTLWFATYYDWFTDDTYDGPSSRQYMLGQWSRGGDFLAVGIETYPTPAVSGASDFYHYGAFNRRGVTIAPVRRKLYMLLGSFDSAQSILEYDLDTGVTRYADKCFGNNVIVDEIAPADLYWDEIRDRLWTVERYDSNGDDLVCAYAYDPDDFNWQNPVISTPTPTAPVMTVVLFQDFVGGPSSEITSFAVDADNIYFYCPDWDTSERGVYSVPISESGATDAWTLLASDPDWNNDSWDMVVPLPLGPDAEGSHDRDRRVFWRA